MNRMMTDAVKVSVSISQQMEYSRIEGNGMEWNRVESHRMFWNEVQGDDLAEGNKLTL